MPRKAKPTKHSRKDLDRRRKLATTDKGGGRKGREARGGGKTGGAKYQCYVCFKFVPDATTMSNCCFSFHLVLMQTKVYRFQ